MGATKPLLSTVVNSAPQVSAGPPSSAVSFSMVSVIRGQPQSEKIKWKIPEVNNALVLTRASLWVVPWSLRRLHSAQPGANRPFVQQIHMADAPCLSVWALSSRRWEIGGPDITVLASKSPSVDLLMPCSLNFYYIYCNRCPILLFITYCC